MKSKLWYLLLTAAILMLIVSGCGKVQNTDKNAESNSTNDTEVSSNVESNVNTPKSEPQIDLVFDVPEILNKNYNDIVSLLGKPSRQENKDSDTVVLVYQTPEFDIEITLFMDLPASVDITPKEDYVYGPSDEYALKEVPDDVMKLLTELGLEGVDGAEGTSAQRLFKYFDYGSPLREYDVMVNCDDWRTVDEGKTSKVSFVYIKLVKTS
ncbi:hypothetical protein SAMN05660649_04260 [Desulfotomaculum arcticum]|uniref:Lipoprotein n=1 Tax=Desulfotruncus arcticus DSM 17038 TaxID=1121424 RepID=A0A1I2Y6Z9_9FIRM|nr:hypothetical protein [Desulfotruncus arcticus]SFH21129.1 hypothetical protein SAMN05660649_04260 [Desulfotomaculum arcticum] [Desulfotruncus arcticus DSM 17038]